MFIICNMTKNAKLNQLIEEMEMLGMQCSPGFAMFMEKSYPELFSHHQRLEVFWWT